MPLDAADLKAIQQQIIDTLAQNNDRLSKETDDKINGFATRLVKDQLPSMLQQHFEGIEGTLQQSLDSFLSEEIEVDEEDEEEGDEYEYEYDEYDDEYDDDEYEDDEDDEMDFTQHPQYKRMARDLERSNRQLREYQGQMADLSERMSASETERQEAQAAAIYEKARTSALQQLEPLVAQGAAGDAFEFLLGKGVLVLDEDGAFKMPSESNGIAFNQKLELGLADLAKAEGSPLSYFAPGRSGTGTGSGGGGGTSGAPPTSEYQYFDPEAVGSPAENEIFAGMGTAEGDAKYSRYMAEKDHFMKNNGGEPIQMSPGGDYSNSQDAGILVG